MKDLRPLVSCSFWADTSSVSETFLRYWDGRLEYTSLTTQNKATHSQPSFGESGCEQVSLNWLDTYLAAAGQSYSYADIASFHGYGYAQPEDVVQGVAELSLAEFREKFFAGAIRLSSSRERMEMQNFYENSASSMLEEQGANS